MIRGRRRALKTAALQSTRQNGRRKVSVHDFHSFRVTWITLALAAGVPLELVQCVTGHRTVSVVLKHYFRPGREDFRQAIFKAMPKMLGEGGSQSAIEQARDILERSTAKTWRKDRERLRGLLERPCPRLPSRLLLHHPVKPIRFAACLGIDHFTRPVIPADRLPVFPVPEVHTALDADGGRGW